MLSPHKTLAILYIAVCVFVYVGAGNVPKQQIDTLQALFAGAGGSNWNWRSNYTKYGIPWNFTTVGTDSSASDVLVSNPCGNSSADSWQGLTCSTNCSQISSETCSITSIQLANYSMIGSLPSNIGNLPQLESLDLRFNPGLGGALPQSVASLTALKQFIIAEDKFTGPFPTGFLQCSKLVVFDIDNNDFSGTIPSGVGVWTDLELFVVAFNSKLNGTIPSQLGSLTAISTFSIAHSSMTGTIPPELGSLSNLVFFSVRENAFTGSLPIPLLDAPSLQFFLVGSNYLTGDFSELNVPSSLLILRLNHNMFSGPYMLPKLCDVHLFELLADENFFSGTLPSCIGYWNDTTSIDLGVNNFIGTVPTTFRNLDSLNVLALHSNFLSGTLDGVFPPPHSEDLDPDHEDGYEHLAASQPRPPGFQYHPNLVSVVLSDNGFTGSLPDSIFNSTSLRQFIASKNCFSGSLSSSICNAVSMCTLSVSGLTAGRSCVYHILPGLGAYTSTRTPGSIPSCLYNMSGLLQLSIAGNGIISELEELPPTTELRNLSMSFNHLHGKIPVSIQQLAQLENLDLSFNHLIGGIGYMVYFDLNESSPQHANINLDRNVLSGPIPSSFADGTTDIAILSGNHFTCLNGVGTLPQSDHKADSYVCGSDLLNSMLFVSCGVVTLVAMYGGYYFVDKRRRTGMSTRQKERDSVHTVPNSYAKAELFTLADAVATAARYLWMPVGSLSTRDEAARTAAQAVHLAACTTADKIQLPVLTPVQDMNSGYSFLKNKIWAVLADFRRFVGYITLFIVVVFTPMYLAMSIGNTNSQTFQYGWILSIAFIRGHEAGIVVMVMWLVLLVGCMVYEMKYIDRNPFIATRDEPLRGSRHVRKLRKFVLILVNVTISCVINGAYVYVVLTASLTWQLFASCGLVAFELAWLYLVAVPWLEREAPNGRFILILISCMFNIILIPALATMVVDVQCFERVFVDSPAIVTGYSYSLCGSFDQSHHSFECLRLFQHSETVEFTAPFIYSELCFTSLLTNYVPIYVLTYGVVGILNPVLQVVLTVFLANAVTTRNEVVLRWMHWVKSIDWFPIFYLFPVEGIDDLQVATPVMATSTIEDEAGAGGDAGDGGAHSLRNSGVSISSDNSSNFGVRAPSVAPVVKPTHRRHMYLSRFCAMSCVLLLTLLLTFGVTYPPLAVLLLACICLVTLAFQLSIYFHYRELEALDAACYPIWEKILADELRDLHRIIHGSRTAVYVFASVYAAFAVFELTSRGHVLMIVLLVVLLAVTIGVACYVKKLRRRNRRHSVLARKGRSIQLQTVFIGENVIEMQALSMPEEWKDNVVSDERMIVTAVLSAQRDRRRQTLVGGLLAAIGDDDDDGDEVEVLEVDLADEDEHSGVTTNPMRQSKTALHLDSSADL